MKATVEQEYAELQYIYDCTPVGLSLVDRELRVVRINRHLAGLSGMAVEEAVGRKLSELLPADLSAVLEKVVLQVIETGEPVLNLEMGSMSTRWRKHRVVGVASFHPLRNAGGQVKGVMAAVQDITERKLAEEALERWEHIFQHAAWGVVVVSADGRLLELMNPGFARMHGYEVHRLKSLPLNEVFAPGFRPQLAALLALADRNGRHIFESLQVMAVYTAGSVDENGAVTVQSIDVETIRGRRVRARGSSEAVSPAQEDPAASPSVG